MKLKINDTIKVVSGADKGRTGKITRVFPRLNTVLVDGLNQYQKHLKPRGDQKGGIVTLSRPLPVARVMLVCPHCQKPTRVKSTGQGKDKLRICQKCRKNL